MLHTHAISQRAPLVHHAQGVLWGGGGGAIVGAICGIAAGWMLDDRTGAVLGAVIGIFLGGFAGAMAGHAATNGAEQRYAGDPRDLIGYIVLDRDGHRMGKVASVYLAADGRPWYLGVLTTWLDHDTVHLMPTAGVRSALQGRRMIMPLIGEALRQAPTARLHERIDRRLEDQIWGHFEPRGLRPMPMTWEALPSDTTPGAGTRIAIAPEAIAEDDAELGEPSIDFSGDAPYRVAELGSLEPLMTATAGQRPSNGSAPATTSSPPAPTRSPKT